MRLSPREIEKLMLHQAGCVAQKRYARGVRLNYVEAVALISAQLLEFIREGDSVAALMDKGKGILGLSDVMEGVASILHEVQVEGTFPDGTKLVTVHEPICREQGDAALALYGSGLTRTAEAGPDPGQGVDPGAVTAVGGTRILNAGRESVEILVTNQGDRPVQVGSHYPFVEVNAALEFDRAAGYGRRLNIPAGTAVRFEPGETRSVELVDIAGERIVRGGNALTNGALGPDNKAATLQRVLERGFRHQVGGGS